MKGKKKLLLVVILLLLFGCGTFVTYSIYRTSYSGSGSLSTATWSVAIKKGGTAVQNLNFGIGDVTWTSNPGKNGKIAPGATGTITYTIDASGSEVGVAYEASVGTITGGAPASGFSVAVDPSSDATGTIPYASGAGNMTKTITFKVVWLGDTNDSSAKDTSDLNADGNTLTIPVEIKAYQAMS